MKTKLIFYWLLTACLGALAGNGLYSYATGGSATRNYVILGVLMFVVFLVKSVRRQRRFMAAALASPEKQIG
ncbi:LPXTG cell wall anchor domain-containing protein [Pseudomonas shahriarae]|uniref:LPXTG cell wall anchor domain-containing protein n=1 Tax=Pseudomonas shahriarae TaxID=2745512 RepID=A0A9X4C780_9PSED|nr:LPXTG cell wall anchor domain-containing protein [Pseudomonas shahriarae]MDD1011608.1 LPXTG cell wall anchor domain-containing protein [Pseudomonas shahriarae]